MKAEVFKVVDFIFNGTKPDDGSNIPSEEPSVLDALRCNYHVHVVIFCMPFPPTALFQ